MLHMYCWSPAVRVRVDLRPRFMRRLGAIGGILICGLVAAPASAQPVYSITFHGPPKAVPQTCPGPFPPPITEGDLLRPGPPTFAPAPGPLPPPCILFGMLPPFGLMLPAGPAAIGTPPGVPGFVEVDAVSFGADFPITPGLLPNRVMWALSVDKCTVGIPGVGIPPNVFTTGAATGPAAEASADVFIDVGLGSGPACLPALPTGNTRFLDGNGVGPLPPAPGLMGGAPIEPNPPIPAFPSVGADLDALDIDPPFPFVPPGAPPPPVPIWFSLDGVTPNLCAGVPNSGSAPANGPFVGGDVLIRPGPGVPPAVYAPAFVLGIPGPGNDLDALILSENGIPGFQPPTIPFSWVPGVIPGPPTDMLFFSVRPGTAIIGVPNSGCGTPIGPADILWPPLAPGAPPRTWVAAAQLGLTPADNIDALDLVFCLADLNGDGFVNGLDLASMLAAWGLCPPVGPCPADLNGDGIINGLDLGSLLAAWGMCP